MPPVNGKTVTWTIVAGVVAIVGLFLTIQWRVSGAIDDRVEAAMSAHSNGIHIGSTPRPEFVDFRQAVRDDIKIIRKTVEAMNEKLGGLNDIRHLNARQDQTDDRLKNITGRVRDLERATPRNHP